MVQIPQQLDFIVAATRTPNDSQSLLTPQILHKNVARHVIRRFDSDGPGELASTGPRHDNDHVYIDKMTLLPTADECLSSRAPWMPSKNINSPHFLPQGYARNVDLHFRLLRHDSVEKIRNINYDAAQQAFLTDRTIEESDKRDFLETKAGNRYFLYHNLRVEGLIAGESDGVVLHMSFDCPEKLRGRQMHKSTRLMKDMLSAVLVLNHETNEISIQYFNIQARNSTYSLHTRGGQAQRAAVELLILPGATKEETQSAFSIAVKAQPNISMALVEYPRLLYAGFANVLHCLQKMSDFDYAFGRYVSPRQDAFRSDETRLVIRPPSYSQEPDFAFKLHSLTGDPESCFFPNDLAGEKLQHTLKHLEKNTTLDHGQAIALLSSLTRELSFTQGPPGCGKTFLGVALTQVLLASRPAQSEKPILLVCRTNHALDNFMTDLRDAGVQKLVRIGNGSKVEWTKSINIRAISQEHSYSLEESGQRFRINEQKNAAWVLLDAWCRDLSKEALTGLPCWQLIYPIVRDHYPKIYSQLVTHTSKPSASAFTYDYWAEGGDLTAIQSLHQELLARLNVNVKYDEKSDSTEEFVRSFLADIVAHARSQSSAAGDDDVWQLPLERRKKLIGEWQTKSNNHKTMLQLLRVHEYHKRLVNSAKSLKDRKDVRAMIKQNVIGMTTTACASRWEMLKEVGFEIMICEEAAEVLEAHNLCSLLPTLKHAIHIGDPQQLRPMTEEQSLALENVQGKAYRLDESLFERMMKPIDDLAKTIPTTKLHVQRRMHPEVAKISRITYPFLRDHESTYSHPLPKGLQHRLWWLDHRVPEDAADGISKSVTNNHEVGIVRELVTYLLRGNDYSYGDIAILTPYSGQLLKLREALSAEFSVWLSDTDKDSLVDAGAIDPDSDDLYGQKKLSIVMNKYVRLATIDNFQGEEAKIIILSTVRSGERLGFVRSANRINVACSRARDGFYVVGDSKSMGVDSLWNSIITVFQAEQRIGEFIRLQCDRHSEHHTFAKSGQEIAAFATCTVSCKQRLDCGHLCPEPCHEPVLHQVILCQQSCRRELPCGHRCRNKCGNSCGPCEKTVKRYLKSCGHAVLVLCSTKEVECDHFEGYYDFRCGKHAVGFTCSEPTKSEVCDAVCGEVLPCGHACDAICGNCDVEERHPECAQACNKSLPCRHHCKSACHSNSECPTCKQPAKPFCCHEQVRRNCNEDPTACLVAMPVSGSDGQMHEIACCFTTKETTSHSEPKPLTPLQIQPLIQPIITSFIERSDHLHERITHRADVLSRTLQLFLIHQIQPMTIAAKNTITSILHRTDETASLQTEIIVEQQLLTTFTKSLHILSTYHPSQAITSLSDLLPSRLNELELRIVLAKARDTFAIVNHLSGCEDLSGQMRRTAGELVMFAEMELRSLVAKVGTDVSLSDLVGECRCLLEGVVGVRG